jgi:hypothetical protein
MPRAYDRHTMTRAEAETEAARLNRDRTADGPWAPHHREADDWEVVRLIVPGLDLTRPTGAHVESRPKPPYPGDPRPPGARDLPPGYR